MDKELILVLKEIQKDLHTIAISMQVKDQSYEISVNKFEENLISGLSPEALKKITNPRLIEKINNHACH